MSNPAYKAHGRRFRYFVHEKSGINIRTARTWWKPFFWLGTRRWFR